MVEWLSLVVGAVDELVVDVGIGMVRTGISLVADITGSLLGRGSTCVFVYYMRVKTIDSGLRNTSCPPDQGSC